MKFFAALFLLSVYLSAPAFAAKVLELQEGDCSKCHKFQTQMVVEGGGRHATTIGCMDCHPSHPPESGVFYLPCGSCHIGQPHYKIGHCLHCHTDPHRPLISLRDPLKPARKECLSCHETVGELMAASPSQHAELFCNRCHDEHKRIPGCLECHVPHTSNQATPECQRCHPAHQPLKIELSGYMPAGSCLPCHKKEAQDLAANTTNHSGINCTYCHAGLHPNTPACSDCHGLPHDREIHTRYRDCLECHGDAHRLIDK